MKWMSFKSDFSVSYELIHLVGSKSNPLDSSSADDVCADKTLIHSFVLLIYIGLFWYSTWVLRMLRTLTFYWQRQVLRSTRWYRCVRVIQKYADYEAFSWGSWGERGVQPPLVLSFIQSEYYKILHKEYRIDAAIVLWIVCNLCIFT